MELRLIKQVLGFNTLRVFLHSMLFEADAARLQSNLDDFLGLCDATGFRVGIVFFDDCWNWAGANLSHGCRPEKGVHNGYWMASPQASERTTIARFEPFVTEIVRAHRADTRVAWWETFNEPKLKYPFVRALQQAAFCWAKAQAPTQPVASCWDDSNATDLVDHHQYTVPFQVRAGDESGEDDWRGGLWSNPSKGGFLTEAGARWYTGMEHDSGSPIFIIEWLEGIKRLRAESRGSSANRSHVAAEHVAAEHVATNPGIAALEEQQCQGLRDSGVWDKAYVPPSADEFPGAGLGAKLAAKQAKLWGKQPAKQPPGLRAKRAAGSSLMAATLAHGGGSAAQSTPSAAPIPPFVPGVMINWEAMVGYTQTRWQWSAEAGAAEPPIPWHGHIFPDGTPVSFTEAAAIRRYATGIDDFLAVETFNYLPWEARGQQKPPYVLDATRPSFTLRVASTRLARALTEVSLWPGANGTGDLESLDAVKSLSRAFRLDYVSVLPPKLYGLAAAAEAK